MHVYNSTVIFNLAHWLECLTLEQKVIRPKSSRRKGKIKVKIAAVFK